MTTTTSTPNPTSRFHLPRPFVGLRGITRADLPSQITAGVTLAALMIPLNIGYAAVAGLSPEVGLYAALLPMITYAVFATSRQVIAGPDAAIAALMGSLLIPLAAPGDPHYLELALVLSVLCGIFFILFWLFKLGFLANYLSRAVLIGLITGLGIEVLFSQIRKIMGVSVEAEGFFREVWATIAAIPLANLYSVGLGLGTIALIRVLRGYVPKVPGALVALLLMTAVVAVFGLADKGVSVLGQVPAGLPGLTLPRASFAQWMALIPGALALVALTASEGLLLARNYAQNYNYVVDSDQEMFAYGVANVAAGFTGALPVGTSSSRSAAMDDAGMRSQWPTVVAAIVVALVLLFFTDLLALLPSAVLAGVVANAVLKLIDIAGLRELYAMRRSEFWIAIVCLLGVLVLGTLAGLTVAFLLTTIAVVGRAARPQTGILTEHSDGTGLRIADGMDEAVTAPGLIIYRFGGPLFFANATFFREQVEQWAARLSDGDWFTLDAQAVNDIDVTGAEAFRGVLDYLHSRQVTFAMSGAYAPIPELLARYDLAERIGEDRLYVNNREALVAFYGETGRPVPDPFAAWIKTNPGTAVSVDREVGID